MLLRKVALILLYGAALVFQGCSSMSGNSMALMEPETIAVPSGE